MFKCDNCGVQTDSGKKKNTVKVVRPKEYTHYRLVFDKKIRKKKKEYYTTTGYETVKELHFCKDCYEANQGDIVDGNTQGKGRGNQITEKQSPSVNKRSEVRRVRHKRIG